MDLTSAAREDVVQGLLNQNTGLVLLLERARKGNHQLAHDYYQLATSQPGTSSRAPASALLWPKVMAHPFASQHHASAGNGERAREPIGASR